MNIFFIGMYHRHVFGGLSPSDAGRVLALVVVTEVVLGARDPGHGFLLVPIFDVVHVIQLQKVCEDWAAFWLYHQNQIIEIILERHPSLLHNLTSLR